MREIKVRAWDLKSNVWRYWNVLEDCMCDLLVHGFIDKKSLGEWTGLKDKRGKEIYEGNIVKRYFQPHVKDCKPIISTVEWRNSEFYLDHPMLLSSWPYDLLEVIGNIYENPELLKR